MNASRSKLFKAFVENSAHFIILLIGGVSQAEDGEFHPRERLLRLVLQDLLQVLEKIARVIAGIPFVMRRDTHQHKGLLAKLFLFKAVKVDNLAVLNAKRSGLLIKNVAKLLRRARLTPEVDPNRWQVAWDDERVQVLHSVLSGLLCLFFEFLFAFLGATSGRTSLG